MPVRRGECSGKAQNYAASYPEHGGLGVNPGSASDNSLNDPPGQRRNCGDGE